MTATPEEVVAKLDRLGMAHIYVDGGVTIQRFLTAGLIQHLVITRVPVLIGEGIPLFGRLQHDIRLERVEARSYRGGLVCSEYRISLTLEAAVTIQEVSAPSTRDAMILTLSGEPRATWMCRCSEILMKCLARLGLLSLGYYPRRAVSLASLLCLLAVVARPQSQPQALEQRFDAPIAQGLKDDPQPGVGAGIVHHGRLVYWRGFGAQKLGSPVVPMTERTLFHMASITRARHATTVRKNAPIFVFQDNFWVNLNHFLRAEALRRARGIPLELSVAALKPSERAEWESALTTYSDLAKRSFIFDETLTQIDNVLAMESGLIIGRKTAINPKFVMALNEVSPIYRQHRWDKDHLENRQWIAAHAPSIAEHAPRIKVAIGKVFGIAPPTNPILVDVVRDIGLNLAYTTQGPAGFSGHTFISAQANSDPNVALDTILHEISHTIDDPIIAIINAESARQHVRIPSDLWHAMTLYTTGELVRQELGRTRSDPTYAPNSAFFKMYAEGAWHSIFNDLETCWLPYLNGKGNLNEALAAVINNAPR